MVKSNTTIIGDTVICDLCNEDYTTSDVSGGIYFSGKAVCPSCTPNFEKIIKDCKEEEYIKDRCPKDVSYADWVRNTLRGGEPGSITITTF